MAAWNFGVRHAIQLYWRLIKDGSSEQDALAHVLDATLIDQERLENYIRRGGTAYGFPDGWGNYVLPDW